MNTIRMMGQHGYHLCSTTTATTGVWNAIVALSDTVFSTLTDVSTGVSRDGTLASMTFPAGVTIFGAFTNFTLTSGSVMCYKTKIG